MTSAPRRTQAERRRETQAAVLGSAARLFGDAGYAATSLEQIAADAGTTIRPVYHYFGNKQALFEAVVEAHEAQLLEVLQDASFPPGKAGLLARFRACLTLLSRRDFQRVVLVDAPAVLGKSRWADSPVVQAAGELLGTLPLGADPVQAALLRRMLIGALTEAALTLAESRTQRELEQRTNALLRLAALLPAP
ncbi:MAG: helix-turn-helix domain-containing protein [Polyangiales bacterium]|nr:TetR/AcrR family transcriptional regulator [Myxococcales bacterium]MCB9659959.1 TetR/AcrR family transcriptional regulator [Sandaracinaceae bacterium]